jgi:ABC-type bacteriocin/lantibiotic exporter with double-glycine peptidase domain
MFRFAQSKDNAVVATSAFLKAINAKVSDETIEETLKSHPDYPSLLSLSDSMTAWKVENVSARLSTEQLAEVPLPFLAYLPENGGMFALVKKLENNIITWFHSEKGWQTEKTEEFAKKWQGVVLMAEADENSVEPEYTQKNQKQHIENLRTPLILIGLVAIMVVLYL